MTRFLWIIAAITILLHLHKFYKAKAAIKNERELKDKIESLTLLIDHIKNEIKSKNDIQ